MGQEDLQVAGMVVEEEVMLEVGVGHLLMVMVVLEGQVMDYLVKDMDLEEEVAQVLEVVEQVD